MGRAVGVRFVDVDRTTVGHTALHLEPVKVHRHPVVSRFTLIDLWQMIQPVVDKKAVDGISVAFPGTEHR